jgi:hypothetical protein
LKDLDRRPGALPDIHRSGDASVTYSMVIGVVRGLPAKLIVRQTEAGDLLVSIDRTPVSTQSS